MDKFPTTVSIPLDPSLPDSLLAFGLISELLISDDLLELGEHLSPNHHTEANVRYENYASDLRHALVRPPVALADKSCEFRVEQVARLCNVC